MWTVLETKNHPNMKYAASLILALVVPSIALADDAEKAKLMELGKAGYMACAACHGMDGQGVAAGPKKMAPSLTGSKIAMGDPAIFTLVLQNGIAKESQDWLGVMAALGPTMDDEKIAAVMTYVRNSFGNTGSVVTAADAKKFREQYKAVAGPVTRAKLAELSK
jgi:mono/diheme cytochrome c family protein